MTPQQIEIIVNMVKEEVARDFGFTEHLAGNETCWQYAMTIHNRTKAQINMYELLAVKLVNYCMKEETI
jgi:hypothetical protein